MRLVAYVRRSTRQQALSRAAQLRKVREWAAASGHTLVAVETDTASGKSRRGRDGFDRAVAACRNGEADGIVAAKLDRLSRSVVDFGQLLEDSRDRGYAVVVLDHQLDTSTANGRLVANVLASVAAWEREIIGERTRDALAEKIASGEWSPSKLTSRDRGRILEMWNEGRTLAAITRQLAHELGRVVHRTSVANVLRRECGQPRGRLRRVP